MKKQLLSIIAATSAFTAFAQLPVSQDPENRKAVLEEFTGIYCGYCPDGHRIANTIYNSDPANVVLINIHSGGFANVAAGEPDLKTSAGNAIDAMPGNGITGYPAGTMNRSVFTGTAMSGGRGNWTSWAGTVKTQAAYCNVALEGFIDTVSVISQSTGETLKVLTVNAEVYYTDDSPASTNSLTVMLLEDSVVGPQHNYGTPYYNLANYNADGSYNHNHVLRAVLTSGVFGKRISTTTSGTTYKATMTYTLPEYYGTVNKLNPCIIKNLKVVGFVTETYKNTINANHGPITYKVATYTGVKNIAGVINDVALYPNPASVSAKVRINASESDKVAVAVYNQIGQLVYETSSKEINTGVNDLEINTQNWSAGLYNVVVTGKGGSVAKKLTVAK